MSIEQPVLDLMVGEQYQYDGHVYDVIGIYDDSVELASTKQRGEVRVQKIERLEQAAKRGRFTLVQAAPFAGRQHRIIAALDAAGQAQLDRRRAYTEAAVREFSSSLPREAGKALIERVHQAIGDSKAPCYNTVRNWLKRYLHFNQTACALIPFKKLHQNQWERLPEIVRVTIEKCLEKYFYIPEPECLSDVIGSIEASLEEYNRSRPATDKIKIPSQSTLRRRIGERSQVRRLLTQKGRAAVIKAFASNKRHRTCYRLLERIEGDTHVLDLELVDDQGKPIGKAALTILLDVGSRKVIGWDISVNPASALKSLRALKPSLLKYGVGENYILDNGSENTDREELGTAFAFLGPNITYCRVRCPNEKTFVERWFKSLTTGLTHEMRGTTRSNPDDCGDYPSEANAMYTLPVVKQRFEYWLENVYHQRRHATLNTSPNKKWEALVNEQPPLRRISPEDITRIFWRKTSCTVTNNRVRHDNLQWTAPTLGRLTSLTSPERKKLDVYYDASDLGSVLVCHPEYPEKAIRAEAVDGHYQNGLTLDLHHEINDQIIAEKHRFDFRLARDHKIILMEERFEMEGKRGRRKAAQIREKVRQVKGHSRSMPKAAVEKSVMPSAVADKFRGAFDAPPIGAIWEGDGHEQHPANRQKI